MNLTDNIRLNLFGEVKTEGVKPALKGLRELDELMKRLQMRGDVVIKVRGASSVRKLESAATTTAKMAAAAGKSATSLASSADTAAAALQSQARAAADVAREMERAGKAGETLRKESSTGARESRFQVDRATQRIEKKTAKGDPSVTLERNFTEEARRDLAATNQLTAAKIRLARTDEERLAVLGEVKVKTKAAMDLLQKEGLQATSVYERLAVSLEKVGRQTTALETSVARRQGSLTAAAQTEARARADGFEVQKSVRKVGQDGGTEETVLRRTEDGLERLVRVTRELDSAGRALSASTSESARVIARQGDAAAEAAAQAKHFADVENRAAAAGSGGNRPPSSSRTTITADGTRTVETLKNVTDGMETLTTVTRDYDRTGKQVGATLAETNRALDQTGNKARVAGRNFVEGTLTVAAWAASVGALYGSLRLLREAIEAVAETQRKTALLGVIYRGQAGDVKLLRDQVLQLAGAHGRESAEALDAAVRWARLGLTRRQILEAVTVTLKAANVAEIDAAEAAEHLTAVMAAFQLQVTDLAGVLNNLNSVSNKFNTTNKDLLQGIARVGALAKQSGLSLQELIATVGTGVGLTGRSGAEFGNAIKSIIVSLVNPEIQGKLSNLFDIDLREPTGQLKTMDKVLGDLFVASEKMNATDRQQLLQIVGKKQQASRLAVVLNDYMTIQRNLVQQLKDGNITEKESEAIRATLVSQLVSLKSNLVSVAVAVGDFGGAAGLTSGATTLLEFVNSLLQAMARFPGTVTVVVGLMGLLAARLAMVAIRASAASERGGFFRNSLGTLAGALTGAKKAVDGYAASYRPLDALKGLGGQIGGAFRAIPALFRSVGGAIAFMGKAALFAVRGLLGLAGTVAGFIFLPKILEAASDVFKDKWVKNVEEANRAMIGFNARIEDLRNNAQRLSVLENMGKRIREVLDSVSTERGQGLLNELAAAAADPGDGGAENRLRQRFDMTKGVLRVTEELMEFERAAAREAEIDNRDRRAELVKVIRGRVKLVGELEREVEAMKLRGQEAKAGEVADKLKEEQDALHGNRVELEEMQRVAVGLRGAMIDAMNPEQAKMQAEAIKSAASAMGELLSSSRRTSKVLEADFARRSAIATLENEIDRKERPLRKEIDGLISGRQSASPEQDAAKKRLMDIRVEMDALNASLEDAIKAGKLGVGGVGGGSAENRRAIDDLIAQKEALATERDRVAVSAELTDAQVAADMMVSARQKDLEALTASQREQLSLMEAEALEARKLLDYALQRARAEELIARARVDERDRSARSRIGRDGAEQGISEAGDITRNFAARGLAERVLSATGNEQGAFEQVARMQEQAARVGALEVEIASRRYAIEAEIVNARRQQNEEAAKALAFATREDQARAALLRGFIEQRGRGFGYAEFSNLSTESRQSVRDFNPAALPSQLDPNRRLVEERGALNSPEARQLPEVFRRMTTALDALQSRLALTDPTGLSAPAEAAASVVNLAPGAIKVSLSEDIASSLLGPLKEAVLGAVRVDLRVLEAKLSAVANGRALGEAQAVAG